MNARDTDSSPSPGTPETPSYDYDVFISYSSQDKKWVRGELLKRIEQAGLRAFIDYRDFRRGAPSIKEMERGVTVCRKTLLVLTPDFIKSGWTEIESIMLATLDPANREIRTLPLLKTPCDQPLRIRSLTHIDFTVGADLALAWRQLLTALGAPPEPVQAVPPARDNWYLAHPYAMPPNFTGRVAERAMLTQWLTADAAHPLLVLRALGGFGKSALTWHWLLHDVVPAQWPRVVWWSFYEGDASFESFVAKTLHYLSDGRADIASATSASPRAQLDQLLRMLHSGGTLLILDGFERALRAFGGLDAAYRGDEAAHTESGESDCISPLAELFLRNVATLPGMRSKVLLTTRLRPAPVETRGGILLQG
ncbi:MAG TPA: TIR domain-containing protein, partial [Thermoanaerobaculia bacterium]|nr:TIR domain-containing protein [Thermoanaerobaculia bacterium]